MAKRILVPKTRNNGTMSEAAFFGWLRSSLRQRSRFWKPISAAKNKARRKYTGANKRQKWEYQCAKCKNWFKGDDVAVDHIHPAGTLRSFQDLAIFAENLFCEVDGLQVLCTKCHDKKTAKERKGRKK